MRSPTRRQEFLLELRIELNGSVKAVVLRPDPSGILRIARKFH
jgi:hypothetical protein